MQSLFRYIFFSLATVVCISKWAYAQVDTITKSETDRILKFLAADERKGRGNGTAELQEVADFIAKEYEKSGLHFFANNSFYSPFHPHRNKVGTPYQLRWNKKKLSGKEYEIINTDPVVSATRSISDFAIVKLDSFFTEDVLFHIDQGQPDHTILVWTDKLQPGSKKAFPDNIKLPPAFKRQVVLVYAKVPPIAIELTPDKRYQRSMQYNMVGMLPGTSNPKEIILFSAHYDHVGQGFNGANDNASGVTALLLLANYFAKKKNNQRTLLFCAFSGEEIGLLGSTYFSNQINVKSILAGINLEMLGVPQYGAKTVFITGTPYSALPSQLIPELEKVGLKIVDEPAVEKQLFQRSDNYPFAKKGIPAHAIMASDDDEPCYHKPCDNLDRMDTENLTALVQAIAKAVEELLNKNIILPRIR